MQSSPNSGSLCDEQALSPPFITREGHAMQTMISSWPPQPNCQMN